MSTDQYTSELLIGQNGMTVDFDESGWNDVSIRHGLTQFILRKVQMPSFSIFVENQQDEPS